MPLDVHRMWNNTSLRFQPSVKPGVIRRGSRELGLDGISAGGRDKRKSKARSTDGGGNEAGDDCGSFGHRPDNGRFLRHRFSPKSKVIAIQNSLPKRSNVAKEAVSAAWQTKTRQRSERICKPNDAPRTKPRPCVKTMLCDRCNQRKRRTTTNTMTAMAITPNRTGK